MKNEMGICEWKIMYYTFLFLSKLDIYKIYVLLGKRMLQVFSIISKRHSTSFPIKKKDEENIYIYKKKETIA